MVCYITFHSALLVRYFSRSFIYEVCLEGGFVGWFTGLSKNFLAARTARLLVLAGTDRLDKELMIGQMQGKFQLAVVPGVGHMLHEVNYYPLALPLCI